jgi:hypothetical protein
MSTFTCVFGWIEACRSMLSGRRRQKNRLARTDVLTEPEARRPATADVGSGRGPGLDLAHRRLLRRGQARRRGVPCPWGAATPLHRNELAAAGRRHRGVAREEATATYEGSRSLPTCISWLPAVSILPRRLAKDLSGSGELLTEREAGDDDHDQRSTEPEFPALRPGIDVGKCQAGQAEGRRQEADP